jgi:hypothetical protein
MGSATRSVKQGNLILVVLFAAGVACVYLLSLRGGPAKALAKQEADEIRVTSALAELQAETEKRGVPAGSAMALVDTFYYETCQRQVPLERLAGNPFEFEPPGGEEVALDAQTDGTQPALPKATRASEALEAVKQLHLQSVVAGPSGAAAMISNTLLCEGQVICGWTVTKINPQSVLLTWQDQTYELKMH